MNKQFRHYAVIWSVALIVFSMIVFLVPDNNDKYDKFGGAFWAGYILIFLAFIGQLVVSYLFFKEENKEKRFLNLSVISLGTACLVLSLVFGTALMLIPNYPQWLGAIIAFVLLGFYTIAAVAAKGAAEIVYNIDQKVAVETSFVKAFTAEAENLISKAKSEEAKIITNKVFEAIRYSNKSSHGGLDDIESRISEGFSAFSNAISDGDDEMAESIGESLLELISERDKLAKLIK